MANNGAVTGLCYISINGQRLHSEPDATLTVGGPVGEASMSTLGFVGIHNKEIQPGSVKFKLIHTGDLDISMLQRLRNQTLTFETDSGQRYLIRNAGTIEAVELSKNSIDIKMAGNPAELC
ncbi:phage tail tube protein [Snodgrassella sp. B3088]|uniref:phage tail tube protein n=1 Tax=Snodgrassella TaxID=1193515 RepID=UPI00226A3B71|nr:phage tail tube protein [Snodgrassella sp. B3088]MCX8749251.1 phage tail tube protein [Snodgrassella sp. B3088]